MFPMDLLSHIPTKNAFLGVLKEQPRKLSLTLCSYRGWIAVWQLSHSQPSQSMYEASLMEHLMVDGRWIVNEQSARQRQTLIILIISLLLNHILYTPFPLNLYNPKQLA
jgi:hypothetical protein